MNDPTDQGEKGLTENLKKKVSPWGEERLFRLLLYQCFKKHGMPPENGVGLELMG
ncbi:MAG: hypothetical protein CM15mP22_7960 [Gammaproteobacteria bacterium]|nr:MAG: hypothetical protein CM15mP22_7960 [Gammaproteobacteria bacterium]